MNSPSASDWSGDSGKLPRKSPTTESFGGRARRRNRRLRGGWLLSLRFPVLFGRGRRRGRSRRSGRSGRSGSGRRRGRPGRHGSRRFGLLHGIGLGLGEGRDGAEHQRQRYGGQQSSHSMVSRLAGDIEEFVFGTTSIRAPPSSRFEVRIQLTGRHLNGGLRPGTLGRRCGRVRTGWLPGYV